MTVIQGHRTSSSALVAAQELRVRREHEARRPRPCRSPGRRPARPAGWWCPAARSSGSPRCARPRPSGWVLEPPSTVVRRAGRRGGCCAGRPRARSACAWPIARPTSRAPTPSPAGRSPAGPPASARVRKTNDDGSPRRSSRVVASRPCRDERVDAVGRDVHESHVMSGLDGIRARQRSRRLRPLRRRCVPREGILSPRVSGQVRTDKGGPNGGAVRPTPSVGGRLCSAGGWGPAVVQ